MWSIARDVFECIDIHTDPTSFLPSQLSSFPANQPRPHHPQPHPPTQERLHYKNSTPFPSVPSPAGDTNKCRCPSKSQGWLNHCGQARDRMGNESAGFTRVLVGGAVTSPRFILKSTLTRRFRYLHTSRRARAQRVLQKLSLRFGSRMGQWEFSTTYTRNLWIRSHAIHSSFFK